MENQNLAWLLQPSNPSVRYFTLRHLLGRAVDDHDHRARRETRPHFRKVITGLLTLALGVTSCVPAQAQYTPTLPASPTEKAQTPTHTPTATATRTPSPTPTPVYKVVQDVRVPVNVYLDDQNCIPMELQGQEKCVNLFVHGIADGESVHTSISLPTNMIWKDIVYVIGDVNAENLTIQPGTEVYVAAHSDIKNLFTYPGNMLTGINTSHENIEGVHYGEYFWDEGHHISIIGSGTLTAVGTENQPILLTSSAAEPTRWDWNETTFGSMILDYVTVEYSRGISPRTVGDINESIFRHIAGGCIWSEANNDLLVENSQVYDCSHEGIGGNLSNATIMNNIVGPVQGYVCIGMNLITESRNLPEIEGNTLTGCGAGIYIGGVSMPQSIERFQEMADRYLPINEFIDITDSRFVVDFTDVDDFKIK